ncbi:MAG: helix-turn-helix domain-containing protein [Nanoarchaeota archaeon]
MIKNKLPIILAEKELNIKQLADLAGIRYATLHAFAKNKTKSADYSVLNRVCKTLGTTPGDILKYIPDEESEVS